ncbi:MAG: prepilin peptidase [Candidatus Methanomethyliaceae archaeon]|nr:prepilin peptidase [Candidatus Methanomethyliaceae archaeon]MDW7971288.1 A24 family peptidase C-terminal domain-containing protein [Nitrososphaerota archaeon]
MLSVIKSSLIGIVLLIASIQDVKSREIDDRIWLFAIPIGLLLTIAEALTIPTYPHVLAIISIIVSIVIALGFAYFELYGGADAKAIITIAFTLPIPPDGQFLIFPITVFGNALMIVAIFLPFLMILCLIWNLFMIYKGMNLFSGYNISTWKKILVMLIGVKVKSNIAYSVHFNIMERIGKNGRREIRLLRKIEEEKEKLEGDYLWASFGLPLIVFIFAGYLIYFLYGDLMFNLLIHFL